MSTGSRRKTFDRSAGLFPTLCLWQFRFVTDPVFEKGRRNDCEEDLEHVLLEYGYNDRFNLAIGRNHTAIGYYNLAFRPNSWFQTATGRPFLFEDEGGILPTHNVGLGIRTNTFTETRATLHCRGGKRTPWSQPGQSFVDYNVNLALFSRPDAVPGPQVVAAQIHGLFGDKLGSL